jgi:hypothetical protein
MIRNDHGSFKCKYYPAEETYEIYTPMIGVGINQGSIIGVRNLDPATIYHGKDD